MVIEPPPDAPEGVPWIPYGPAGDRLPERFVALVEYETQPLRARIAASFNGAERVRADVVSVERTDGASVSPEDLTTLQLGAVMSSVVWQATRRGKGVAEQWGRSRTGPLDDAEVLTLARMYWFEYVSWGKPRLAIMAAFKLPRSTANRWIRKAREVHGLPGAHADEEA
ncbi:hypothetical protein [Micromonospora sp. NPDC050495]|uniref:hypothetical protein n=1 Tax=Micromonospora sp. NPDC050495 TaxID=3154936 RepID=UPI00340B0D34